MKTIRRLLMATTTLLATACPVFAVDTTQTYSSGVLVIAFLAFCALIVVVQLMPTIVLLVGFIKGLVKGTRKQETGQGS